MQHRLRKAIFADLAGVLALNRHLSPDDPELSTEQARPAWDALLSSPMSSVIVADAGEVIASGCVLVIVPNLTRGARPFAVIENVVTDPRFRKQGLGTAVLQFAMAAAWAQGCYKVMLSSGRTDESTLRFYEKAGFERGGKTFFEARRI